MCQNQQNKPLDVLHELEVGPLGGDLLHRAGADLVDQVAEDNSVSQDILEAVKMSWTVFERSFTNEGGGVHSTELAHLLLTQQPRLMSLFIDSTA